jgi:hypothetical protein
MGFKLRFRRSVRVGKWGRINFTKTGIGASVGRRGMRKSWHSSGRKTTSIGIPGTGLYLRKDERMKAINAAQRERAPLPAPLPPPSDEAFSAPQPLPPPTGKPPNPPSGGMPPPTSAHGRRPWRLAAVLIVICLAGLVALVAALQSGGSSRSKTVGLIDASTTTRLVPTTIATSATSPRAPTTVTSSATTLATTAITSTTSLPTTSVPPPTVAPTRATTATTAATVPPQPAPLDTEPPPPPAIQEGVTPGAFCAPVGAYGHTDTGVLMICSLTNADGVPYSGNRARWHAA